MRLSRVSRRRSQRRDRRSPWVNEDLLGYEGRHGSRALCHLVIHWGAGDVPVCLVGNFDGGLGTSTTNAIQVVATAIAERIGRNDFRLIEWYPHWSQSQERFSEVVLNPVPPTKLGYGQVVVGEERELHTEKTHAVAVRFADPQWTHRSEDDIAKLLGEEAVRELRSFAGIEGDYTPERLFGSTGRQKAEAIRAHNRQIFANLEAQSSERT